MCIEMSLSDWGNVGTIVSAIATIFIGFSAYTITKYQYKQTDRKIVEDIFSLQNDAYRIFSRTGHLNSQEAINLLAKAKDLARLYALDGIKQHLKKVSELYIKGYGLYFKVWDQNSGYRPEFNQEDMNEYHEVVTRVNNIALKNDVYSDRLKIL